MKTKLKRYAMPLSIVGCLILIYLCTIVGITSIPFGEANRILLHEVLHLPVNMEGISAGNIAIIWNVRLPRVILGFLTGGALAVCGAAYQGIFKNPMADPFILGVSSGCFSFCWCLSGDLFSVQHFKGREKSAGRFPAAERDCREPVADGFYVPAHDFQCPEYESDYVLDHGQSER